MQRILCALGLAFVVACGATQSSDAPGADEASTRGSVTPGQPLSANADELPPETTAGGAETTAGGAETTAGGAAGEPATSEPPGEPVAFSCAEPSAGQELAAGAYQLEAGFANCCVKEDGTLWCWGRGSGAFVGWQQARFPQQVGSAANWSSISVGSAEACALRQDGTLWCFGRRLGFGVDGTLTYVDQDTPIQVANDADWRSVSVGEGLSCGIKHDGSLWCWGYSYAGLFGAAVDDEPAGTLVPVKMGGDTDWATVTAGSGRACSIKNDGTLYCFGTNYDAGLGDGSTVDRAVPTPVVGGGSYRQVALGNATCGLRVDGTLWCWGYGFEVEPTQLGMASDWQELAGHSYQVCTTSGEGGIYCLDYKSELRRMGSQTGYTQLTTGCAKRGQAVECWGSTPGDGNASIEMRPLRVGTDSDWTDVAIRWQTQLGLHAGGKMDASAYETVNGTAAWTKLAIAAGTECAIRAEGTLFCWGSDVGAKDAPFVPVQVGSDSDWLDVATSLYDRWTCGIRSQAGSSVGKLWCRVPFWGLPLFQVGSADWSQLSAGYSRMCGVRADGSLACWTMAYGGCPGCGYPQLSEVGSERDWASVSVGKTHACAIRSDASLWCWGTNFMGELGIGTRESYTPTPAPGEHQVAPGSSWSEVAAGDFWTCGIRTDGSLWCWGDARNGQLGLGEPGATRLLPERVGKLSGWQHIAVSGGADAYSCGIRQGQLWCWGENQVGLVTHTWGLLKPPAQVLQGPAEQLPFCAVPRDNDYDGYAGCLGDCDDTDPSISPFISGITCAPSDASPM